MVRVVSAELSYLGNLVSDKVTLVFAVEILNPFVCHNVHCCVSFWVGGTVDDRSKGRDVSWTVTTWYAYRLGK